MKNTIRVIRVIAIIAVIGLSMAACEEEKKHGFDFDLRYLPGTWKTTITKPEMAEVTIVFSDVKNGKITMTLFEPTPVSSSGGGGGSYTHTGSETLDYFLGELFGGFKNYRTGIKKQLPKRSTTDADDGIYVWEREYSQKEVSTLRWELSTLQGDAELTIKYLVPAGECDCDNCEHLDILSNLLDLPYSSSNCCSDQYCGKNPQGDVAALLDNKSAWYLIFKKQK